MTMGRGTSTRLKTVATACILCGLALSLSAAPAAESAVHGGATSDVPRELALRPEVVPYELESVNRTLQPTNQPFLKEPELSQQHVFRSVLRFGKGTNNAFALIWDQPKRRFYLDLNQNLDLTDDPTGVFSSTNKGFGQFFADVAVPLKTAKGLLPAVMDLWLTTDADGKWVQARLASRSLWQAKVALGGEEWQVAVMDGLFGSEGPAAAEFLLLRPWAVRTNRVVLRYPAYGVVPFPNQLFWLGRAFHVEPRVETSGATPVCRLELGPQQPPLTELKLSGESLCYAVLRATNGYTVLLHDPPGTVKVPQGAYAVSAAWLKKGPAEAYRLPDEPLAVNATAPTNVVLGGPLTNSVTLTRQGRKLLMNYRLTGADSGSYRLAQQDRSRPPEFTVYHGGKKVQSGKFEFG